MEILIFAFCAFVGYHVARGIVFPILRFVGVLA